MVVLRLKWYFSDGFFLKYIPGFELVTEKSFAIICERSKLKIVSQAFFFSSLHWSHFLAIYIAFLALLAICIDPVTNVKSLRRELNLFKHTLCFAFFKTYTSHFFINLKIALQNVKFEALIQTLYTVK